MANFNPFAGGKIVNQQGAGWYTNQGGIGLNKSNSLFKAFGGLIEPCAPYKENWTNDGNDSVQIGYRVPWSLRKPFVEWMCGYSMTLPVPMQADPGGGGNDGVQIPGFPFGGAKLVQNQIQYFLSRAIPYQCPATGYEHFYVSDLACTEEGEAQWFNDPAIFLHDVQGNPLLDNFGSKIPDLWPVLLAQGAPPAVSPSGVLVANNMLLKYIATFTPRPYEVRSDSELAAPGNQPNQGELERYVERLPKSAVQNLPLPSLAYKFVTGPNAGQSIPASGQQLIVPTEEINYVLYEWPDVPWTAITNCVGYLNNAPFDGARGWPTFATGTLLCQAPLEKKRYRHKTGRWYWKITLSFLYRGAGWNFFPDSTGVFQQVSSDGTANGKPVYYSADQNQWFVPPAPTNPSLAWPGG